MAPLPPIAQATLRRAAAHGRSDHTNARHQSDARTHGKQQRDVPVLAPSTGARQGHTAAHVQEDATVPVHAPTAGPSREQQLAAEPVQAPSRKRKDRQGSTAAPVQQLSQLPVPAPSARLTDMQGRVADTAQQQRATVSVQAPSQGLLDRQGQAADTAQQCATIPVPAPWPGLSDRQGPAARTRQRRATMTVPAPATGTIQRQARVADTAQQRVPLPVPEPRNRQGHAAEPAEQRGTVRVPTSTRSLQKRIGPVASGLGRLLDAARYVGDITDSVVQGGPVSGTTSDSEGDVARGGWKADMDTQVHMRAGDAGPSGWQETDMTIPHQVSSPVLGRSPACRVPLLSQLSL